MGVYLHIPFCDAICNYCNFNRGLLDGELKTRYLEALGREIHTRRQSGPVDTLFFGGGTPSVLDASEVAAVIGRCRSSFDLDPLAEITLEINPEGASPDRLAGYRAAGVNRVSFGVQSFRDDERRRLGRLHSTARAVEAFGAARAAGFDDISMDLMGWLPEQTLPHWLESVDTLVGLVPDHASLYLLELYPNAPLRDEMAVFTPITSPCRFSSGPPLLPGLIAASVCRKSSRSAHPGPRPFAEIMPDVTVNS